METAVSSNHRIRFRDFELDIHTSELYRDGVRLKVQGQPVGVLQMLLERPGELVRREELRKALWPSDTFVDFDHSLNAAVMKLREALGDTADSPAYIETVPKRGYRLIAPMAPTAAVPNQVQVASERARTQPADAGNEPVLQVRQARISILRRSRLNRWAVPGLALLLVALATIWYLLQPLPSPRITDYVQLTNDGRYKYIAGTDGNNLYLNLMLPAGTATVPVSGGRLAALPIDLPISSSSPDLFPLMMGVSPDGSKLIVGSHWDPSFGHDLWVVGSHGSTARYLARGVDAAWSPDSKKVVYSSVNGDLHTVLAEGGESTLLASLGGGQTDPWSQNLVWSPDGSRIRFVRRGRYWEVSADGTNAHELLPNWHATDPRYAMGRGQWTPNGDLFLFTAWRSAFSQNPMFSQNLTTQLWALDERHTWFHRRHREPIQLTLGTSSWGTGYFAISMDGTKVYTTSVSSRGELVVHDSLSRALKPYLGGISAEYVGFSKDGTQIAYVTYPEGVMWRANRDGTGLVQLTSPPLYPMNPRWSPDGSQILFFDVSGSGPSAIYAIPSHGGAPKRLLPDNPNLQGDPDWSPDEKEVLFFDSTSASVMMSVEPMIHILDIASGKITDLPREPKPLWSPRWSPNGRYIVAMTVPHDALALLDLQTSKWSMISLGKHSTTCNWPSWSRNSRFIYFLDVDWYVYKSNDPGVYRVSITGGEPEKIIDLKSFTGAGFYGGWLGLDPDDNPLLLRNAGTREIYALTLER